jgi:hypothetical protein
MSASRISGAYRERATCGDGYLAEQPTRTESERPLVSPERIVTPVRLSLAIGFPEASVERADTRTLPPLTENGISVAAPQAVALPASAPFTATTTGLIAHAQASLKTVRTPPEAPPIMSTLRVRVWRAEAPMVGSVGDEPQDTRPSETAARATIARRRLM